jgi:hypothetical protein
MRLSSENEIGDSEIRKYEINKVAITHYTLHEGVPLGHDLAGLPIM